MAYGTHINITIDFSKWDDKQYDLRIPIHQPIKQLLMNLADTLNLDIKREVLFAVKVPAKKLLLTDDDRLVDFSVTDGDILIVL